MIIKQFKYLFMAFAVIMFTACGTNSGFTAKELAFQKIEAYTENGEAAPTLQDYIDIGAIGVTEDNLDDINEMVGNLTFDEVDTTEGIQSLVDELGAVSPDITAPVFISRNTASVNENQLSAITLIAIDDISAVTYSISGADAGAFSVNARTGVVTFNTAPVFETKNSYTFIATAADASSNTAIQEITLTIVKVDEVIVHNGTPYGTVTSPYTGKVWLDRNLGAARVCTSFNDVACYGDYYQWGRNFDGHQNSTSGVTGEQATDVNNAGSDFITVVGNKYDWARAADPDGSIREANWSKTDGSSVCPVGFRVPTKDELRAELFDAGSAEAKNRYYAFASFLKLPSAGYRHYNSATVFAQDSLARMFSSSALGDNVFSVVFRSTEIEPSYDFESRGHGLSVRCLKD